jgi:hypothetical protein
LLQFGAAAADQQVGAVHGLAATRAGDKVLPGPLGERSVRVGVSCSRSPTARQRELGVVEPSTRLRQLARRSREFAFELSNRRLGCVSKEAGESRRLASSPTASGGFEINTDDGDHAVSCRRKRVKVGGLGSLHLREADEADERGRGFASSDLYAEARTAVGVSLRQRSDDVGSGGQAKREAASRVGCDDAPRTRNRVAGG